MPTDVELLRAYVDQEDRSALDALFGRHYAAVYHVTLRLVGHESDARDLTQIVFLKALRAALHVDQGAAFRRWLLRIAVNPEGDGLRGNIILPDGVEGGMIHVRVHRDSNGWWGQTPNQEGVFVFEAIPLGELLKITIHLKKDGDGRALVELNDIRRQSDGTSSDPRLIDIDLRSLLRPVTVSIRDAGGVVPFAAIAKVQPDRKVPSHRRRGDAEGKVRLLVRADDPIDAWVWADGYKPQRIHGLDRDQTIKLRRGPEVTLTSVSASRTRSGSGFCGPRRVRPRAQSALPRSADLQVRSGVCGSADLQVRSGGTAESGADLEVRAPGLEDALPSESAESAVNVHYDGAHAPAHHRRRLAAHVGRRRPTDVVHADRRLRVLLARHAPDAERVLSRGFRRGGVLR
ncbi:MAG: hypothetical protein CMJ83_04220 [Planctomycetes bacterium]|nr:hypothetical protein [Planctomycetota bacterium]